MRRRIRSPRLGVEADALAQAHEQHHARVALPLLADREALEHLVDRLDLPVDLGGADAHAARVQHGVGAAVDDHAVVGRELREIAVAPDARVLLEVGGAEAPAVRIVPEAERNGGEGRRADELALLAAHAAPLLVEDLHPHAEAARLDLAAPDRPDRVAADEAGDDVGAPEIEERQTSRFTCA